MMFTRHARLHSLTFPGLHSDSCAMSIPAVMHKSVHALVMNFFMNRSSSADLYKAAGKLYTAMRGMVGGPSLQPDRIDAQVLADQATDELMERFTCRSEYKGRTRPVQLEAGGLR